MRSPRIVTFFLIASAALSAADPFSGKWKLNVEKSNFGPEEKPRGGGAFYETTANGYWYVRWTVLRNGRVGPEWGRISFGEPSGSAGVGVIWTWTSDFTHELSIYDNRIGTHHTVMRSIVSPVDHTLTIIRIEAQSGRPVQILVYDRAIVPAITEPPIEIPAAF